MLRVLLLSLYLALCVLCQDPVILNLSPSAVPGEIITIQGEYFGQNPKALLTHSAGSSIEMEIVQTGYENRFVAARIPEDAPLSLYSVQVQNTQNNAKSNQRALNVPIIHQFDVPEIASGDKLSIFGQNLHIGDKFLSATITNPPVTKVTLFSSNTDEIVLELDSAMNSDSEALYLIVPATAPIVNGTLYNVRVDNGLGAVAYGPTQLEGRAREGTTDYFNLGINMGKDFSSYGSKEIVTVNPSGGDDTDGIMTALNQVSAAGGGIVKLAAGTFISKNRIDIPDNVVLQGAGKELTVINWAQDTFNLPFYWTYTQCSNCGLADLTVNNVISNDAPRGEFYFSHTNKFFIARCLFNVGNAKQFWTTNSKQIAIIDTEFVHTSIEAIGFTHSNNDFLTVKNSRWTYGSHSVNFGSSRNVLVRDSVFQRNSTIQNMDTFHTLVLDFSVRVALINNVLEVIPKGTRALWNNDGETIITEGGGPYTGDRNSGYVRQLADNGRTVNIDKQRSYDEFFSSPYAAIVAGPGLGQIRKIVSNTADTFTVDTDWDVQPVVDQSVISFLPIGAANWLVKGNHLLDNNRGFYLYMASLVNITLVDNTVNSSYGIIFIPYISAMRTDENSHDYGVTATYQYNIQVRNNFIYSDISALGVSDTDTGGAGISINAQQWATNDSHAVLVLGMELKQNTIHIDRPQMKFFCGDSQARMNDGIYASRTNYQNAWPDELVPTILGTIAQDNRLVNLATSFTLGSGAHNTILACSAAVNSHLNISVCTYHPDSYTETKPDQFTLNLLGELCPARSVEFTAGPSTTSQPRSPGSDGPQATSAAALQCLNNCVLALAVLFFLVVAQ